MTGTESLWERIDETHDGTKYDPIPYSGSMALENGKYYTQDGVTYLCNRQPGVSSAERAGGAVCGGSFGVTIAAGAA